MSYIDPYMQKALLGPLYGSQGDPQTPQYPSTPQAPIAPTGAPMAPQGMPGMAPPQMGQRDLGLSQIYNALGAFSGLGNQGNPWEAAHAQKLQNFELQNQRMRALQQRQQQQDPLVRGVKQYAEAAGITHLPWDEQVAAYRKAKFAPESRTASMKDTEFFRDMDDPTRKAWFEREGYQVEELPDGSLWGIGKDGEKVQLWDAQTMQAGAEALAAATTRGAKRTEADEKFRSDAITNLQQSSAEEAVLQGALDTSEMFLERIESGDLEGATGMVSGFFSQLGFGPEPLGELDADQVRMTLANLGITNLAPVTVREIMMVNQMWAQASAGKEINVGRLKSSIRNIQRALSDLEYERNRNLKNLQRYGSEDDYNFYYDQYGTVDSIEELLGGGTQ